MTPPDRPAPGTSAPDYADTARAREWLEQGPWVSEHDVASLAALLAQVRDEATAALRAERDEARRVLEMTVRDTSESALNARIDASDAAALAAMAERDALRAENEALRAAAAFGQWCLEQARGEHIGHDIDGGEAQDKALELGLFVKVRVTEPCCENCACAEWDDFPQDCIRLAAARGATGEAKP